MTTYEHLVDATLAHGLMPPVVPQLKTITHRRRGHRPGHRVDVLPQRPAARVGARDRGAHRRGDRSWPRRPRASTPTCSVPSPTPTARSATPCGCRSTSSRCTRSSGCGTCGSATSTRSPTRSRAIVRDRAYDGEPVDFLDGTVFTADEAYLTLGPGPTRRRTPATTPGRTSTTGRSSSAAIDYLTVRDYLWRWDTDWFWCSRAFGAQNPRIRRMWPKRWLRSDVYWKLIRLENRYHVAARLDAPQGPAAARAGGAGRRDPARPHGRLPALVPRARCRSSRSGCARSGCATTGRLRCTPTGHGPPWPLYPLRRDEPYVNVGFWSTVAIVDGAQDGDVNRRIEAGCGRARRAQVAVLRLLLRRGRFWDLYGGADYPRQSGTTTRGSRLPDLYAKAVKRR